MLRDDVTIAPSLLFDAVIRMSMLLPLLLVAVTLTHSPTPAVKECESYLQ